MWAGEATGDAAADAIIAAKGLRQISDEGAIGKIVDDAIAANLTIVAEYRAGKEKVFNALVGKVMAASKGKANPAQVNAILKRSSAESSSSRSNEGPRRLPDNLEGMRRRPSPFGDAGTRHRPSFSRAARSALDGRAPHPNPLPQAGRGSPICDG